MIRQLGAMDPQIADVIGKGDAAIADFLKHSARLSSLMDTKGSPDALQEVSSFTVSKDLNPKVSELCLLVRDEASTAVAAFRDSEMWIRLKAPAVSDGNNFGVDVQNFVLGEVQHMRAAMEAMTTTGRDYHWSRAQGLEKLFGEEKQEKTSSQTHETDEKEKSSTVKKSSSEKSSSATPPGYADYKEYVHALDVRHYQVTLNQLLDVRNNYLKAHVLFTKNMKRLSDPRGEGEDGKSGNAMSMF